MRLMVIVLTPLMLIACGSQDSGTGAAGGDATPAVSAESTEPAAVEVEETVEVEEVAVPSEVTSCLSLVKQGEFKQAVDACLAALDADPDNSDVKAALSQAREQVAKLATADAAGMAGEAATEAATDAATGAAAEAAGELPKAPTGLQP